MTPNAADWMMISAPNVLRVHYLRYQLYDTKELY